MDIKELKEFVTSVVAEAKKKKGDKDKEEKKVFPKDYRYSEAFDFSTPLGPDHNLYYQQGRSSLGGFTSGPYPGGTSDFLKKESKNLNKNSAWRTVFETLDPSLKENVWEAAIGKLNEAPIAPQDAELSGKLKPILDNFEKNFKDLESLFSNPFKEEFINAQDAFKRNYFEFLDFLDSKGFNSITPNNPTSKSNANHDSLIHWDSGLVPKAEKLK